MASLAKDYPEDKGIAAGSVAVPNMENINTIRIAATTTGLFRDDCRGVRAACAYLLVGLQEALAVHAAELVVLVSPRHEVRLQRQLVHEGERARAGRLHRCFVFLRSK